MLILTAFNQSYAKMGSLCVRSLSRYVLKHPHVRYVANIVPNNFPRPASWYKLELLKQHLPKQDYVLWIDCDALIVGDKDFMDIIKDATLNICKDANGLNNGVAAWKNCPQSFEVLQRLIDSFGEFAQHEWWEQAPLQRMANEVDIFLQPKPVWNAYGEGVTGESDVTDETMVIHWPGMSLEERLPFMEKQLERIAA